MSGLTYETDWLGSSPVFYNERTCAVSENINEVIDWKNFEFHPEGLRNFFLFGYSVFGQTPVRDVKFVPPCTRLQLVEGKPCLELLPDPCDDWLERRTDEREVWELLEHEVRTWEDSVDGPLLIPTSGGYDSRVLNYFVRDKSRIRSFTYGLSRDPSQSFEVVHAAALSKVLGTRWQEIKLGDYHGYMDAWNGRFGLATHAHGMYHMEFYDKLFQICGSASLGSGIIGDAWAGAVHIPPIRRCDELLGLAYHHGLCADEKRLVSRTTDEVSAAYFEQARHHLQSPLGRIVHSMRCKLMLLSYLLTVPRDRGFHVWTPYLKPEIALRMLTIAPERRAKRLWQQEFFSRHGVDIESMNLASSKANVLNRIAWNRLPGAPLDERCLGSVVETSYVTAINQRLFKRSHFGDVYDELFRVRYLGGVMHKAGLRSSWLTAYGAYLVMKPLEHAVRRVNAVQAATGDRIGRS